jgi:hypothetical protein
MRNQIKKEIIEMNSLTGYTPDWVIENINKLVDRAIEFLEKGEAKDTFDAAFKAVDECF